MLMNLVLRLVTIILMHSLLLPQAYFGVCPSEFDHKYYSKISKPQLGVAKPNFIAIMVEENVTLIGTVKQNNQNNAAFFLMALSISLEVIQRGNLQVAMNLEDLFCISMVLGVISLQPLCLKNKNKGS